MSLSEARGATSEDTFALAKGLDSGAQGREQGRAIQIWLICDESVSQDLQVGGLELGVREGASQEEP